LSRLRIVRTWIVKFPRRLRLQICVKPRKSKVAGFCPSGSSDFVRASRPNSISRVFSGCSVSPYFANLFVSSKGWAEMIRKVYEVDPMLCPECGGRMRFIAFLTDYSVVDRIINHL
jgi:hypothetical protein